MSRVPTLSIVAALGLLAVALLRVSGAAAGPADAPPPGPAGGPPVPVPAPVTAPWPKRLPIEYRDPDRVKAALDEIAARPAWGTRKARVERYGTSAGGRPLWLLRTGPDDAPQVLVHGGLGARDCAGTAAAIAFADEICTDTRPVEGAPPPPTPPVANVGYIVIPAPNPDALAAMLDPKRAGPRMGGDDLDRDRDGRAGEDGPDDLDADGEILSMRRTIATGSFVVDDAPARDGKVFGDPRLMKDAGVDVRRAAAGTASTPVTPSTPSTPSASYERPIDEGQDDDGDGDVNEDSPGTDLTRNFVGVWDDLGAWPTDRVRGDGRFPSSAPEVHALMELSFVTSRLIAWYAFTSEGPRLERASERGEDANADDALYTPLAAKWKELSGGVELRKASERPGASENRGSDLDWAARHLGVIALRVPVWRIAKEEKNGRERADPDELDWLLWNDRVLGGKGFVPWHEVQHAQWGTADVGGWKRFTRYEPPADMLAESVRKIARVPVAHEEFAPRLAVLVDVMPAGPGVARVKARAVNRGGGPTETARAQAASRAAPVRLQFAAAAGVEVLAGPKSATVGTLAAGAASSEVEWLVRRADAGALGTVTASARTAAKATAEATLK